jgi:hypothetical protein
VVHGGPARSVCAALCMCAALQLVGEAALAMGAALRDEDAAVPLSGLWPPAEGLRAGVDVGEWLAGGGGLLRLRTYICATGWPPVLPPSFILFLC